MQTRADVHERVAAGIDFLNGKEPDWVDRIDLDNLDLMSGARCVIGQLEGDFGVGVDRLGLVGSQRWIAMGFYSSYDEPWTEVERDYAALTEEWKTQIEKIRANEGRIL